MQTYFAHLIHHRNMAKQRPAAGANGLPRVANKKVANAW
jgi:hypothetical protein